MDRMPVLQDMLKHWAWAAYKLTSGTFLVSFNDLEMTVAMDKVKISFDRARFFKKTFTKKQGLQPLYNSSLENGTDDEQIHNIQVSEQTTSAVTTTLTKGFTRGDSGTITLNIPSEVTKSTSHLTKEVVINEDTKTTRKSQTWNSKLNIKVPPHQKTVVKMYVVEKGFQTNFKMNARLYGKVRVIIKHRASGKLLKVVENDLVTILKDIKETELAALEPVMFESNKAVWPMEGRVKFEYGVELKVKVWHEDLQGTVNDGEDEEEDFTADDDDDAGGHNDADDDDDANDNDIDDDNNRESIREFTKENHHQPGAQPVKEAIPQHIAETGYYTPRSHHDGLNPHPPLPGIKQERKLPLSCRLNVCRHDHHE